MPDRFEITLKNDLSEIERLSRFVGHFAELHGLPSKVTFALNLALDELLTNTITYAYDDREQHLINVCGALVDHEVTIEIEDDGREYNPLDAPEPDVSAALEDRPIGGLGVHLVKNLVDSLEYRRDQGKNILAIKKKC